MKFYTKAIFFIIIASQMMTSEQIYALGGELRSSPPHLSMSLSQYFKRLKGEVDPDEPVSFRSQDDPGHSVNSLFAQSSFICESVHEVDYSAETDAEGTPPPKGLIDLYHTYLRDPSCDFTLVTFFGKEKA